MCSNTNTLHRWILFLLPLSVFCLPQPPPQGRLATKLSSGTFRGFVNAGGVETWLGIPFAQPPTGKSRFKPPVKITAPQVGIQNASAFRDACSQPDGTTPPLNANRSEDCLFLNVWRPAGTKPGDKLPVAFWLHGGGYITGAASQRDPTPVINRSIAIDQPFIFVSSNYRLGTFGFLASGTMPPSDLNVGLQDIHAALVFVQENIASFGGDPDKVTMWGISAGGGAIQTLMLYPPEGKPTFRAGVSHSSTGPFKSAPSASQYDGPGKPFSSLLSATNCTAGGALTCLQSIPYQTLNNISNTMIKATLNQQLWEPATGPPGSLLFERPSKRIKAGKIRAVPFLSGTVNNEGATFSVSTRELQHSASQESSLFDNFVQQLFLNGTVIPSNILDKFHTLYPANDTSLGAPFNTENSLFDRSSAWYGDNFELAPRRLFFDHGADLMPMYGYIFKQFIPGNPVDNGVFHTSEIGLIYETNGDNSTLPVTRFMQDAWINFINHMAPGPNWPRYDNNARQIMQLISGNITLVRDDWGLETTNYLNSDDVLNAFEK